MIEVKCNKCKKEINGSFYVGNIQITESGSYVKVKYKKKLLGGSKTRSIIAHLCDECIGDVIRYLGF